MEAIFFRPFIIIRTYHIRELLQHVIQTLNQEAYVRKLLLFKFHNEYKLGTSDKVVDAFSRVLAD